MSSRGYGLDTSCAVRLVSGRYVTGTRLIAEALYRRFTTPRGVLIPLDFESEEEEPAYGFDVSELVGRIGVERAAAVIPSMMRGEALKDDRVQDVAIAASISRDARGLDTITIQMDVTPAGDLETFPLTLTASAAGVAFAPGGF